MKLNGYATQYKQVHSANARGVARHLALSSLASFYKVSGQMSPLLKKNRIQFLYLHYVFEDEKASFRKLLEILSREHRFISYSEAVAKLWNGDIDAPYIAFSFDDGLKSNVSAAQIMSEFGIKACFFICPPMIGETDYFKIKEFCSHKLEMPPTEFLSWNDVETLLKEGHEIGGHTVTHRNLAQLSKQQVQEEITKSFELLTKKIGGVTHFAWPFGRFFYFGPSQAKTVFEAGYQSCASAERGCHVTSQVEEQKTRLCIRRDNALAKWPVDHILYFMARNSQIASAQNNEWPKEWLKTIEGS